MARLVKLRESALSLAVSSPPTPSIVNPPIYLTPSIDVFTPSPSPLPAVLSAHRPLSKAAVVGGTVAGFVALAVVTTVLSTAAGKVGASCFLTPALNLLSSLGTKFGICSKCPRWISKKDNCDHADGGGGGAGEGEGAAAAESLANRLQVQEVVTAGDFGPSTQAFISTSMSKFAASEMKKHESIIDERAHYAQAFLSTNIGDSAAHYAQAFLSTNIGNSAPSKFKKQEIDGAISKYAATELEFMRKEVVQMSRFGAIESKKQDSITNEASVHNNTPSYQPITRASLSTYDAIAAAGSSTPGPGLIETSVSEKYVQDKGGKNETTGSSGDINGAGKLKDNFVANSGGKANTSGGEAAGPMVPMPAKTKKNEGKPRWHATAADRGSNTPITMEHVSLTKSRRPTNLGHVSLNCEVSAHRLRFFALCNSGGTYGSSPPPSSYLSADNNNNNYNDYYHYHNNYPEVPRYNRELGNHNRALLENPQDLSSSDGTHYYVQRSVQPIMQSYHQCITAAPSTTPVTACLRPTSQVIDTLGSSQHYSTPTIQEYGDPYYGA